MGQMAHKSNRAEGEKDRFFKCSCFCWDCSSWILVLACFKS